MPSPVEALPCGSRSRISTCSPMAASAVPRLIAVVVLPTPPFWLAIAMTRGGVALGMRASGTACGAVDASTLSLMHHVPDDESVGILRRCPAALQLPHDHDAPGG